MNVCIKLILKIILIEGMNNIMKIMFVKSKKEMNVKIIVIVFDVYE